VAGATQKQKTNQRKQTKEKKGNIKNEKPTLGTMRVIVSFYFQRESRHVGGQ
jgi:hypothetical protein